MPLKLIGTIAVIVLFTFFAGFNIDNKCDVNILFKTFKNVPIFLSLTVSFILGVLVTLPFTFGKKKQGKVTNPENSVQPVPNKRKAEAEAKKQAKLAAAEAKQQKKISEAEAKRRKDI